MEHSVTYNLPDGTEYRLTWDTDSGDQMHNLLHEDGVLKLECFHHQVPEWSEEDLRSVSIPHGFFSCLSRHFKAKAVRQEMLESGDERLVTLAPLVAPPHVSLSPETEAYVETMVERNHDVQLLVKLVQDADVERFARQLNAAAEEDEEDYVRPAYGKARRLLATYYPVLIWLALCLALGVAYVLAFGV